MFKVGDYVQFHKAGRIKASRTLGEEIAVQYEGVRQVETYKCNSSSPFPTLVVYRVPTQKFHIEVDSSYFELAIRFDKEYV